MANGMPSAAASSGSLFIDAEVNVLMAEETDRHRFDTTPERALALVRDHDGPVFIDLDETLYLRNSTEDFIDLARPSLIALLILRLLDILQPWRLTGGNDTRDVWRVQLVRHLFPWTMRRWKAAAPALAAKHVNAELMQALKRRAAPPIVMTVGFTPIVTPLVAALGLADAQIVACRCTATDRRRGKLAAAIDALGEPMVRRALLVTDSFSDLPLLRACERGALTEWAAASYRPAFAGIYFPGQYISWIKRPGEHYLRRAILQEDYLLWVLSSIALAPHYVYHVLGLLLLLLSFWAMYEAGYVDNDKIAARFERSPALTRAFHESPVATPRWQPWIWSALLGAAGLFVIRAPGLPTWRDAALWPGALVGTYGWFAFYNRSDKQSRIWMYIVLQIARTAAFALIVPVAAIGAMALAAHALTRWMPYYMYRLVGKGWPIDYHIGVARLLTFMVLGVFLALAAPLSSVFNWTALILVLWCVARARRELLQGIRNHSFRIRNDPRAG
jgi:phosphoserine phosphatase